MEIAYLSESGTRVPAGMISEGLAESADGAAETGVIDDCAAAMPASSKTTIEALRTNIAGHLLNQNLVSFEICDAPSREHGLLKSS